MEDSNLSESQMDEIKNKLITFSLSTILEGAKVKFARPSSYSDGW